MPTLYQRLAKTRLTFQHVCEVGVFEPETSNILEFIRQNIRASLVEADPEIAKRITDYFKGYSATVYPVAIWDTAGTQTLARVSASTFVVDLKSSPTLENDNYQIDTANTFEVEGVVFPTIDDGTIDLISIDIEGGEWYVLKHMVSRPKVISIETHGRVYVNPFMTEIAAWMKQNNYQLWYKYNTDSVYYQQGLISQSASDKLALLYKDFKIIFRRRKVLLLRKLGIK